MIEKLIFGLNISYNHPIITKKISTVEELF